MLVLGILDLECHGDGPAKKPTLQALQGDWGLWGSRGKQQTAMYASPWTLMSSWKPSANWDSTGYF